MSPQPFIITGTERVGSSTFANSLRFHRNIACGWEWSLRVPWARRVKACELALSGDFSLLADRHQKHMATEFNEESTALGYRNLFRANDKWLGNPNRALSLFLDRFSKMTSWWRSEPNIRIIHIVRTDNLAWLRSKFVAKKLESFGAGKQYSEDLRITIPVGRALRRVEMKRWLDQAISELAMTNPYHCVRYEDLLVDRDAVIREAQEFLGFDAEMMPKSEIPERQSKGIPIEQHISNYGLLHSALDDSGLLNVQLPNSGDQAT